MDKFTGKIGYVMYSENRTQNGIRPDMRKKFRNLESSKNIILFLDITFGLVNDATTPFV